MILNKFQVLKAKQASLYILILMMMMMMMMMMCGLNTNFKTYHKLEILSNEILKYKSSLSHIECKLQPRNPI